MIIRFWRTAVIPEKIDEWDRLLGENAIGKLRQNEDCLYVFAGKDTSKQPPEVVNITIWRDLEAIKKFFGKKWKEAYIPPDEAPFIKGKTQIDHYDIIGQYTKT